MPATQRYRALAAVPRFPALLAASLLGRMNLAMLGLAAVLLTTHVTGSYAAAGLVAAAYGLASAAASPLWGRAVDRRGQRAVLAGSGLAYAAVLTGAALAAPALGLVGLSVAAWVAGLLSPPLLGSARATWPRMLGRGPLLEAAYALEATVQELTFIAGPALAGVVAATVSPAAAVIVTGLVTLLGIGTYLLVLPGALASPPAAGPAAPGGTDVDPIGAGPAPAGVSDGGPTGAGDGSGGTGWARVLRAPGFAVLLGVTALLSAHFSAVELAAVAFAGRHGSASAAGWLLATWSVGSVTGGLLYGSLRLGGRLADRLAILLGTCTAAILLLLLVRTPPQLAGVLFLAGLSVAPAISCLYALVERLAPAASLSEAFQWLSTGFQVGAAPGAVLAGWLAQRLAPAAGFAVGAAAVGTAALVATGFRHRLVGGGSTPVLAEPAPAGQAG